MENNEKFLSKEQTNMLKGIMAIAVILHHLSLNYEQILILKPFKYMGFLAVALFFFVSGYGLTVSMLSKKDYFNSFHKRILKIFIPFIIAFIIYMIVYTVKGTIYNKNIFNMVRYSWFIYEILILYFIYYICYKNMKFRKATIVLLLTVFIMIIIIYELKFSNVWYRSTFAFLLGIIIAKYKYKFVKFYKKGYSIKLAITFVIMVISLTIGKFINCGVMDIFIDNVSVIFFVMTILAILLKIDNKFNFKILNYFGNISFELYLYHGLIIELLKYNRYPIIEILSMICIIVIVAICMHKVYKYIDA